MKRLKPGQLIMLDGEIHRVGRVNDCAAAVQPVSARRVKFSTVFGREVSFAKTRALKRISAHIEEAEVLS